MEKVFLMSLGRRGGFPKYAKCIALELKAKRINLTCICASTSEHLIDNSLKIPTYNGYVSMILSSLIILPGLIFYLFCSRLIYGKYVIYFPYIHVWTPVVLVFCKLVRCTSVVTIHDYKPHLGESGVFQRILLRYSSKIADKHIFLAEHVKKQAEADRLIKPSIIVPHGLFFIDGLATKSLSQIKSKPGNYLFVGRISKYKGVELLIEAFKYANLKDSKLIVAGKSNYLLESCSVGSNISIIDKYLDEAEIANLINWADVIVLPYLEATQSGILTFGIQSATPMVCTNVGGISEQVTESEVLLCSPSVDSLSKALVSIECFKKRSQYVSSLIKKKKELEWGSIVNKIFNFLVL